jgi:DNA-binding NtrC family response regulator
LKDVLEATEKKTIIETLDACNYNKKITMRKLGISKSAFYEKLKKYDIKDKK